jgi:hypothetical protein
MCTPADYLVAQMDRSWINVVPHSGGAIYCRLWATATGGTRWSNVGSSNVSFAPD